MLGDGKTFLTLGELFLNLKSNYGKFFLAFWENFSESEVYYNVI